jgi:3-deoxy-manno-octulosonate cytidylyltransferase (CMP-KDO synthetase)
MPDPASLSTAIVIPARYGSERLPGKPLALIKGQTMLSRVVAIAQSASARLPDISVYVATDDERIRLHAESLGVACLMTSPDCATGTDRAREALGLMPRKPDFILNLQGDAPLTPPDFLEAMINSFRSNPCDAVTPVVRLSWEALDAWREDKKTTPLSGTSALFDAESGRAFWFSKQILPALRKERDLRLTQEKSPVFRHIGLYGYARAMLERYGSLKEGYFERLEGLEQLRLLEHDYMIRCVEVDYRGRASMSGIDSPQDIQRAEALIAHHGELLDLCQNSISRAAKGGLPVLRCSRT